MITRRLRAQPLIPGNDPDPPEIETIRVPTSLNRRIPVHHTFSVMGTGILKQQELILREWQP
jgi:hypothetical protein